MGGLGRGREQMGGDGTGRSTDRKLEDTAALSGGEGPRGEGTGGRSDGGSRRKWEGGAGGTASTCTGKQREDKQTNMPRCDQCKQWTPLEGARLDTEQAVWSIKERRGAENR